MRGLLRYMRSGPAADSLIALFIACAAQGLILAALGYDPVRVLALFARGSFGGGEALFGTLMSSMPLILSGLSLTLAFRAGLFNIGSEGQIYVGGLAAALVGHYACAGPLTLPLMLCAAAAVGAAWAAVPIAIRLARGAHEVIGCIMMNYIAINLCRWLVRGPFRAAASTEKTPQICGAGSFPALAGAGTAELNSSFLFAVGLVLILWWLLFRMPFGYELRCVGVNPGAARAGGIEVKRTLFLAFAASGAVSALAGAAMVGGVYGTFYSQFSPGYGFDGITVALLGRNHPLGAIGAAVLFGAMRSSSKLLQFEADISPDVIFLFQGIVIVSLLAAVPLRRRLERLTTAGKGAR